MASRHLAAIMFTDIVGYSALMQADEESARLRSDRHRQVFNSCVGKYQGRIIQYYGDGTLSIFPSTIDCIRCAIEMQKTLREPPRVDVRVGIHVGDVIQDDSSIYGDGVNIASRIETLATPGSIIISERVYDDIRNQADIVATDLGVYELKNIVQPVRVYAIANTGVYVPNRREIRGKTKTADQSLAVLPFMNLSGDIENEYFSDGITEELINVLTTIDGLRVISRTSSFAFKGKNEDIRNIGAQLNVQRILEGSVRKAGNRVRITAQLINATDGFHIWSETFDRDLTDIFQVQDEISQVISNKLRAKLMADDRNQRLARTPTKNIEAYNLYLKGRYYQNKETTDDVSRAIVYYKQAIALEPDFALPYALLAGCYALLGSVGITSVKEAHEAVTDYSDTSLRLDPALAEGYVAKATAHLFFDWNWQAAYSCLVKASTLSPGNTTAMWIFGYYYLFVDQHDKAIEILEEVCALDPLAVSPSRSLGFAYFFAGRYEDTIRLAETQLELAPQNWFAITSKAFAIGLSRGWDAAMEHFEAAHAMSHGAPMTISYLAFALGKLGRSDEAQPYVDQLERFQEEHPDLGKYLDLFVAYWGIGNRDKAFEYVFRAIDVKEQLIAFIINSPVFDGIRQDPRYVEARRRMGFV